MAARIYQRSKNAMQSGKARADEWVLDFESRTPRRPDPLTGWSGGADTQSQVTLYFDTLEAAKGYAERYGIDYHVLPPSDRKLRIQSYADNFR
jgi:ETC complex I subunit conserved region